MKRIIEINEEDYSRIRHFCSFGGNNIPIGWYEIAKSKPLQEEFEEIKSEIQSERNKYQEVGKYTYTTGLKVAMNFIDSHIYDTLSLEQSMECFKHDTCDDCPISCYDKGVKK